MNSRTALTRRMAAAILVGSACLGLAVMARAQSPLAPAAPPQTTPPLPTRSSDVSGAYVGDVLYVHAAGPGETALYTLAPGDTSWTTVWTGPPVAGAVVVGDGDDLYRVGGAGVMGTRRALANLQQWDHTNRHWIDLTPMPSGRTDHAAVVVASGPGTSVSEPRAEPTVPWWSVTQLVCLDDDAVGIACDVTIHLGVGTLHRIVWGTMQSVGQRAGAERPTASAAYPVVG